MDFTEFKRKLGAEPRGGDPEFIAARDSSPEHREAVIKAEAFEDKLERAAGLPVPDDILDMISAIPVQAERKRHWWPMAAAASLLVAVGAAGMAWKVNHTWDSVEAYVTDHYHEDGEKLIAQSLQSPFGDVHAVLAKFDLDAEPALAGIVSVVKFCPTPEGKGVHMVLATESGPVTVIYMPETQVTDREMLAFDENEALFVELENGSAVIIGTVAQHIQDYYAVVHDSIVPLAARS
jgi:hypothetical protein